MVHVHSFVIIKEGYWKGVDRVQILACSCGFVKPVFIEEDLE